MKKHDRLMVLGAVLMVVAIIMAIVSFVYSHPIDGPAELSLAVAKTGLMLASLLLVAGLGMFIWGVSLYEEEKKAKIAAERLRRFWATFGVSPESLSSESIVAVRIRLDELRVALRNAIDELGRLHEADVRREAFQEYVRGREQYLNEAIMLSLEFHMGL